MKRFLTVSICVVLSALLLCLALLFLFEPVVKLTVDNETPFVYSLDHGKGTPVPSELAAKYAWRKLPYSQFAKKMGESTPIRCYQSEAETIYYTVLSEPDYELCYLFLTPLDNGDYRLQLPTVCDTRDDVFMEGLVYPMDLPRSILGDNYPSECFLENHTPERVQFEVELAWNSFYNYSSVAELPSQYELIYRGSDFKYLYRCIQFVMFDVEGNDVGESGLYNYDLLYREDGTARLYFRHYVYGQPVTTLVPAMDRCEEIELTKEEADLLQQVINGEDFESIPTWNPMESTGVDGQVIYIYSSKDWHLIHMWEAPEEFGIYKIYHTIRNMANQKLGE